MKNFGIELKPILRKEWAFLFIAFTPHLPTAGRRFTPNHRGFSPMQYVKEFGEDWVMDS